ncbi:PREDICTED: metalloendopeptidase OMA1, mitochondrial [Nanorana parkeri]|uniref:metalloendopeptidase OMA1, mitochondrial n=1 Tax=Nanorana parkeri TaxID=125878 RepID=UPI000854486A|nr:PREDICTED: metalloendopeptidase OMA1, mitochondrial [Nanorana parkeri]
MPFTVNAPQCTSKMQSSKVQHMVSCDKMQLDPFQCVSQSGQLPQTFSVPQNLVLCANNIHTSARLNVLFPPHVWLFIKPIQKLFAIILGRSVRKWWRALPANKRQLFKENLRRNRWKVSLSALALGFLVTLFYATSLEETPITGRARLLVFRKEHYDLLTSITYESMIEEFKDEMVSEKEELYQKLQEIVRHLIACNSDLPEVAKIEWTLHVVDKPIINAFVLPNGQIFVFTGMLNAVADSDQLSFILCHEMAHAILDHTAEKASVSHLLDFLFLVSLVMIWAICPMDSLAVVGQWIQSKLRMYMLDRPFSRTLETEADKVGLELAAKACVDVRASSVFWRQMVVMENTVGELRIPEWLSTHPSHENRAEYLDRLVPTALKLRESCGCPPLTSLDPRLIFERSMKLLLQASREPDDRAIKGNLHPVRLDDEAPIAAAVRAA